MLLDEKHTIELLGRNFLHVAGDIVEKHPTPASLFMASLRISIEEEAALDAMHGMMWPLLFVAAFMENYARLKVMEGDFVANLDISHEEYFTLRFRPKIAPDASRLN